MPIESSRTAFSYRNSLFALLLLCFAGAILGDSTTEALLLAHFDAAMIPRMYLVNAFFLFPASIFIVPLIDRVDRGALFIKFIISHGVILSAVWIAVSFGATFLYVPLFSYAYVSKILLFLLFWTLANDLIDSRRAGSQFPFIAAGGTLGAIGISFSIPWFLRMVDARNLLPVWVGLTFCLGLAFVFLRRSAGVHFLFQSDKRRHADLTPGAIREDIATVFREPLLRNMAILYFILFFTLLNQHYVFYQAVKDRFDGADGIASFLGYFNGVSMGATFLLQASIAGVVLKRLGSTRAMFFLPAALCVVFAVQGGAALVCPR
ncbi:MAG: hypothetical protein GF344_14770, partial [Chitinivibrionales bacterium]|nr:hypothetical protein [Chitinivibrionales bacterium]MBD3357975.1 hypothetical protein [Chitinivibrionales bacterium]